MTTDESQANANREQLVAEAEKENTFIVFTAEGLPVAVNVEWGKMVRISGDSDIGMLLTIETSVVDRASAAAIEAIPDGNPMKEVMKLAFAMALANSRISLRLPLTEGGVDDIIMAIEKAKANAKDRREKHPEEFAAWLNGNEGVDAL